MRILAVDTSLRAGSIALWEDDRLVADVDLPAGQSTTQSLAPTIAAQLTAAAWNPRQLDLIAVSQGPGSFTGLRVGVTTAKMIAYVAGAEVMGINTLEAIAWQAATAWTGADADRPVWALLDAQRRQLFAACFRLRGAQLPETVCPTAIVTPASWLAQITEPVAVTGPGVTLLARSPSKGNVFVVDQSVWAPRASSVGQLAWLHYQAGRRDDVWTLSPRYYRPSAAEEKRR